jgi:hypothetical protein
LSIGLFSWTPPILSDQVLGRCIDNQGTVTKSCCVVRPGYLGDQQTTMRIRRVSSRFLCVPDMPFAFLHSCRPHRIDGRTPWFLGGRSNEPTCCPRCHLVRSDRALPTDLLAYLNTAHYKIPNFGFIPHPTSSYHTPTCPYLSAPWALLPSVCSLPSLFSLSPPRHIRSLHPCSTHARVLPLPPERAVTSPSILPFP